MNTRYNGSQHDMGFSHAYQMVYNNVASGKIVSATKRRVSWRFGFPNAEAVKKGLRGTDCRGSEHEVNFVWSLTSGKREINLDGKRVHFSVANLSNIKFEESWKMGSGRILKLIAHATPPISPMLSETAVESRQYDLLIDGVSFFDLPYISNFGMGTMGMTNPYNLERNEAPLAMSSRRASTGSAVDRSSDAWPTPVAHHAEQRSASSEWPTTVSQQTNQTHPSNEVIDFFAAPTPAVTQSSPISQPQIPQQNFVPQSQGHTIASYDSMIPNQPSEPAYFLPASPDSATFNVSQDKGMLYSTPKSNIVSSQYNPYGQNPHQNPYALQPQVMHNNGMYRAY